MVLWLRLRCLAYLRVRWGHRLWPNYQICSFKKHVVWCFCLNQTWSSCGWPIASRPYQFLRRQHSDEWALRDCVSVMSTVLMGICPAEEITPKLWFVCPEAQASFVFNFYSYPIPPPPPTDYVWGGVWVCTSVSDGLFSNWLHQSLIPAHCACIRILFLTF